jgi:hypothetical protein
MRFPNISGRMSAACKRANARLNHRIVEERADDPPVTGITPAVASRIGLHKPRKVFLKKAECFSNFFATQIRDSLNYDKSQRTRMGHSLCSADRLSNTPMLSGECDQKIGVGCICSS